MSDGLYFADVCVCCGSFLPEGEMICDKCKKEISERTDSFYINNNHLIST